MGRPRVVSEDLRRRIQEEHAEGKSLRQIARDLNASGTPTAHGGRQWWPSTVRAVVERAARASGASSADGSPTRDGAHA